jgi:hypothetical protein
MLKKKVTKYINIGFSFEDLIAIKPTAKTEHQSDIEFVR